MPRSAVHFESRIPRRELGHGEFVEAQSVTAQHFEFSPLAEINYSLRTEKDYLAIHNLRLSDGETCLAGEAPVRLLDLTGLLTFIPAGHEVSGWSAFRGQRNSFTALTFDLSYLLEGEQDKLRSALARPMIYFESFAVRQTMIKIANEFAHPGLQSGLYMQSLGLAAGIELARHVGIYPTAMQRGALSNSQLGLIEDYVRGNLEKKLQLWELSGLLNLSPFHFCRSFKLATGITPYQFVLRLRIEAAKGLLMNRGAKISVVAQSLGFSNPSQFAKLFTRAVGKSPGEYRDSRLK